MKTLFRKAQLLLIVAIVAMTYSSCTQIEEPSLQAEDKAVVSKFESQLRNYLMLNSQSVKSRNFSKSLSLTPYIYEGDTVMYIVQSPEGWELIASDKRVPMSIMKGEEKSFDMNSFNPNMKDYILSIAEQIHEVKSENLDIPEDASWSWMSLHEDEGIMPLSEIPDYEHGEWVLIEIIDRGITVDDKPHIIKTEWGQEWPWNVYMRYKDGSNDQYPAGCVTVAVGQYAYFLHYRDGLPLYAKTEATYNPSSRDFSFSNPSATAWDKMAKNHYELGHIETAVFLGDLASSLNPTYDNSGTGIALDVAVDKYLNKEAASKYKLVNYDSSTTSFILNQLKSNEPVVVRGARHDNVSGKNIGHAFIIDSYRTETTNKEYVYGWDGPTMSGADPNTYNEDGTIDEYGIQNRAKRSSTDIYFRMNWGHSGANNSNLCQANYWNMSSDRQYNIDRQLIVKK